jgi:hypothetical protein
VLATLGAMQLLPVRYPIWTVLYAGVMHVT